MPDLAAIRRRSGLSLEAIAESTKISIGYLRAIEEGRFDRLPGGIYDVSYLRQYARAIAYDEDELVCRYQQARGITPPSAAASRRRGRRPWDWLRGLAAVFGGFG